MVVVAFTYCRLVELLTVAAAVILLFPNRMPLSCYLVNAGLIKA